MRRGLLVLGAVVALAAAPPAAALLPSSPIFVSAKNERNPAADRNTAGAAVWAFARSRPGFPNRYDAYVKVGRNAAIKLNTSGRGWTGGVDYPTVVYQRANSSRSNIFLYDLSNGSRPATPSGVNTTRWEWHPTISGNWLLFGRNDLSSPAERVVLHNRSTNGERLLSVVTRAAHYLQPDQVNGDWVTWTRCVPLCNVVRYRISTEQLRVLRKPVTSPRRQQYAGSVTAAGVVYLVRSGQACGAAVRIVRYDPGRGDPATGRVIAVLPAGKDVQFSHVRENPDGSVDVLYDRVTCRTNRWDIYKVTDPAPTP